MLNALHATHIGRIDTDELAIGITFALAVVGHAVLVAVAAEVVRGAGQRQGEVDASGIGTVLIAAGGQREGHVRAVVERVRPPGPHGQFVLFEFGITGIPIDGRGVKQRRARLGECERDDDLVDVLASPHGKSAYCTVIAEVDLSQRKVVVQGEYFTQASRVAHRRGVVLTDADIPCPRPRFDGPPSIANIQRDVHRQDTGIHAGEAERSSHLKPLTRNSNIGNVRTSIDCKHCKANFALDPV